VELLSDRVVLVSGGTQGVGAGVARAAGLTTRGTLLDTTPELFDQHIAVSLRGPFFLMQAAVADLVRRGEPGTIANIITSSELGGQPYLAPYVAAKAGKRLPMGRRSGVVTGSVIDWDQQVFGATD
jgi:NAD(P)-dependent dehydrogenase (short-subunit alcohol dehydrogenase family)